MTPLEKLNSLLHDLSGVQTIVYGGRSISVQFESGDDLSSAVLEAENASLEVNTDYIVLYAVNKSDNPDDLPIEFWCFTEVDK